MIIIYNSKRTTACENSQLQDNSNNDAVQRMTAYGNSQLQVNRNHQRVRRTSECEKSQLQGNSNFHINVHDYFIHLEDCDVDDMCPS